MEDITIQSGSFRRGYEQSLIPAIQNMETRFKELESKAAQQKIINPFEFVFFAYILYDLKMTELFFRCYTEMSESSRNEYRSLFDFLEQRYEDCLAKYNEFKMKHHDRYYNYLLVEFHCLSMKYNCLAEWDLSDETGETYKEMKGAFPDFNTIYYLRTMIEFLFDEVDCKIDVTDIRQKIFPTDSFLWKRFNDEKWHDLLDPSDWAMFVGFLDLIPTTHWWWHLDKIITGDLTPTIDKQSTNQGVL